jgi:hypothetical protein
MCPNPIAAPAKSGAFPPQLRDPAPGSSDFAGITRRSGRTLAENRANMRKNATAYPAQTIAVCPNTQRDMGRFTCRSTRQKHPPHSHCTQASGATNTRRGLMSASFYPSDAAPNMASQISKPKAAAYRSHRRQLAITHAKKEAKGILTVTKFILGQKSVRDIA